MAIAPGGSQFKRITNDSDFGVESLYAAYQIQKLANSYGFGRKAKQQSRGQTRYLFVAVVIDLVRDVLIHLGRERTNLAVSRAVIRMAESETLENIGDIALSLIDDYFTQGAEDTIYLEPDFAKTNDLNAFLKSERLFKSDDFSPNLRMQLALAKKQLRKSPQANAMRKSLELADAVA
jgi:hypothetical protein